MSHWGHVVNRYRKKLTTNLYEQLFKPVETTKMIGRSVAMTPDGKWSVLGGSNPGSMPGSYPILIMKRESNETISKFQSIHGASSLTQNYGYSVDISDNGLVIIAGDFYGNTVHVYKRPDESSPFTLIHVFTAAQSYSEYGSALAISPDGSFFAVGEPGANMGNLYSVGKVHIYSWNGSQYSLVSQLLPTGLLSSYMEFGSSLDICDDMTGIDIGNTYNIHIGASGASNYGRMFFGYYYKSINTAVIGGSTLFIGIQNQKFGSRLSVSRDGSLLAVTAQETNICYLYRWVPGSNNYSLFNTVSGPGVGQGSISVSPNASSILIGAPFASSVVSSQRGAAYLFSNTAVYQKTISASDGVSNDWFGYGTAISNNADYILIGAPNDRSMGTIPNPDGSAFGQVYYYTMKYA